MTFRFYRVRLTRLHNRTDCHYIGKINICEIIEFSYFCNHILITMLKRAIAILLFVIMLTTLMSLTTTANAQYQSNEVTLKTEAFRGKYHFVDEYGDTVVMYLFKDFYVYSPLKFKNKKQEEFYWRTVRDVRKTLPYAKLAFETLCETYEYILTIPNEKERERHIKTLEKEIFNHYKPVIKNFTKGQGKMLLKLINRETNQTSFNIVKAFLGSFRAGFWQTFGKFFGMNMKVDFNPQKNDDDAVIDRVATLIEQGSL